MSYISRISKDSIKRFRVAAKIRACDADALAEGDRPAASIYLYGYAAEMTIKAAVFRLMGENPTAQIDFSTLRRAEQLGSQMGIVRRETSTTSSGGPAYW